MRDPRSHRREPAIAALAFLLVTLACLTLGPALHARVRRRWPAYEAMADRWLPWVIAALAVVELARIADGEQWLAVLAFGVAGWAVPGALEQSFRRLSSQVHLMTLSVAVLGLLAHGFADGAILRSDSDPLRLLSAAIALHSLPVGVAIWWLIAPQFGWRPAALAIAGVCAATFAGFASGAALHEHAGAGHWAIFEALVAGSLIHVAFGKPHLEHRH